MAYENTTDITYVNTGSQPNDGTGDPIRTSFFKTNSSFRKIDERLTSGNLGPIYSRTFITANANLYVGTTSVFNGNATFNNDFTVLGVHRGPLTITGNLVVNGTQTILNTVNSVINDSIINLHSPNDNSPLIADDGKDIGIKLHYFKGTDNHAFIGWANDTGYLEYYAAGSEVANVFTGTAYGTIKSGEYFSSNTTNSSSTSTGAIRTNGGLGVALRATLGSLVVNGATTLSGDVSISGSTSIPTLLVTNFSTGNAQITGGSVTGIASLRGTTVYAENFSSANVLISGGSINNTPIGASTATTGRFTDVNVTGNMTVNGWAMVNSDITGVGTIHISDPGTNEGILWDGGNGWGIFEAPNVYDNTSGNLQFDRSGTRVLTLNTDNQVDIPGTTDATSSTSGILKVAGGVGIAKKLYVGSSIVAGTTIVPSVGSGSNNGIVFPADPGSGSGDVASIKYYVTSGESTVLEIKIANDADDYINLSAPAYINIDPTTAATSKVTGALRVAGGVGVGGNVWATGLYADNLFYSNGSSISSVISGAVTGSIATSITLIGTSGTGSVSTGGSLSFAGSHGESITVSGSTVTVGTPQDLQTTANPTFANLTIAKLTMTGNLIPTANVTYNIGGPSNWWDNVYGNAIRAVYADLAENYVADKEYDAGTVLIFGGDEEVTECTKYTDPRVAGVVSTNPAYLMNGALTNGTPIALRGRVPVKVIGPVNKGDFLVTSEVPGHAVAVSPDVNYGHAVFAKSIQIKNDNEPGVIEAVII